MDSLKNTFVINYADGTSAVAKPVPWSRLEDLEILQLKILEDAYEKQFCLGAIFRSSNSNFWSHAEQLAKLIPIVGNDYPGFDLTKITDADELCRIFLTSTPHRNYKTGMVDLGGESILEPSLICKIHFLNFIALLVQAEQTQTQKPN